MISRRGSTKRSARRKSKTQHVDPKLSDNEAEFLREIADRLEANTMDEIERGIAAELLRGIANNEDVRSQFYPRSGFYVVDEDGNATRKRGRRPRDESALDSEREKVDAFLRKSIAGGLSLKAAKDAALEHGFTARSIRESRARARGGRNTN